MLFIERAANLDVNRRKWSLHTGYRASKERQRGKFHLGVHSDGFGKIVVLGSNFVTS